MTAGRSAGIWLFFAVTIAALLAADLGVLQRRPRAASLRQAMTWSVFVLAIAAGFDIVLWRQAGAADATTFATGYLVELALSVDNLLVFALLLEFFAVPTALRGVVLNWGILGALVMRGVMVVAGVALLRHFEWVIYFLGILLIVTGARIAFGPATAIDPGRNRLARLLRRIMPLTEEFDGARFVTRSGGRWAATPLLLVVLVVEWTDLVFATDSIPAIFAITRDPFLVYTSNAFAVVGLRALYFAVAPALVRFAELRAGVALVLMLIGFKMLAERWVVIAPPVALAAVAAILATTIAIGVLRRR